MWNWFNCYLSGRHDFSVWCESGTIYLRCLHCGKRSTGWAVHDQPRILQRAVVHASGTRGTLEAVRVSASPSSR
jgi:hypothetical protein